VCESGTYAIGENFTCWDSQVEGTCEFFEETDQFARKRNLGRGMERTNVLCRGSDGKEVPKEVREPVYATSSQAHVFRYQQKIREAFNPNDLGDSYYVTL
jgi:hypothetical protein